jgi:spore maturation protein CgeB
MSTVARLIGASVGGRVRVAIADDSGLQYSDDYRQGWKRGFEAIGCEVQVFDVTVLRRIGMTMPSPYRSRAMPGTAKQIADQIAKWKPHLVWCHHGRAASNEEFQLKLRREGVRTAVYLCDEPYETGETARYSPRFQFVFTMDPCTVDAHRRSRKDRSKVFYLPPGVDTFHFKRRPYSGRTTPAFFLGNATLVPRLDWLKPVERLVAGADIRFFKTVSKRDPRWVNVDDHPELYGGCVVGLNVHRDPAISKECFKKRVLGRSRSMSVPDGIKLCMQMPAKEGTGFWNDGNLPAAHVNPRFLEMAACGTLVVSDDHRSELARMFPMAPRASDPSHFVELVMHYLKHREEAEKIGAVCSYLISRRHSYAHRAAEVLIRVGLMGQGQEGPHSYLGAQEGWLTPQDCGLLLERLSSAATGPSERWSPQYGMSLISRSGSPNESDSLDVPTPWLS